MVRMKRRALLLASTLLAATLAACGGAGNGGESGNGSEESKEVTLRSSTLQGPDHWQTKAMQAFFDDVTAKSNNTIKIEVYYQDSLVPPKETADALAAGTLDFGYTLLSYTPDKFPVGTWISEAAFLGDRSPDGGFLQGVAATLQWAFEDEAYMKQFEDAGLQPLLPRLYAHEHYGVLCKEPASTLADVEGKRVRVGGKAWSREAENLGMVPVDLPAPETYTSFQQGLIDCFMGGPTDVGTYGLQEIGKHYTPAGLTAYDSASLLMSKATWDKLSKEQQQAVWDAVPTFLEQWYAGYRTASFDFSNNAAAQGVTVTPPDAGMVESVTKYHDDVLSRLAEEAPAGVDGAKSIDDLKKTVDFWANKVVEIGYSLDDATWADMEARVGSEPPSLQPWVDAIKSEVLDSRRPE